MSDTTTPTVSTISTSNRNIMTGQINHFGKYVKLNVGNHLFLTSFDTLTKEDTMFKAMFSGRMEVVQDSEGMSTMMDRILRAFDKLVLARVPPMRSAHLEF